VNHFFEVKEVKKGDLFKRVCWVLVIQEIRESRKLDKTDLTFRTRLDLLTWGVLQVQCRNWDVLRVPQSDE
jgi:hypothetical protein